jgi:transposase-like protein
MKQIKARKSYTKEFKEKMVRRMLPPEEITAGHLAKETGVAKSTFRTWLLEAKKEQKNNTDDIKWIPVNIDNKKPEVKKSIPINIDGIVIEINEGFNSNLLLEVMKVVKKV